MVQKKEITLIDMLAFGHRGLISHSEADLCKMFDKVYVSMLETEQHLREEISSLGDGWQDRWQKEKAEKDLVRHTEQLSEAHAIANDIFEEQVLL